MPRLIITIFFLSVMKGGLCSNLEQDFETNIKWNGTEVNDILSVLSKFNSLFKYSFH